MGRPFASQGAFICGANAGRGKADCCQASFPAGCRLLALLALSVSCGISTPAPQPELATQECDIPHPENPTHFIEGADLHYKLTIFYADHGPPPLEEVFFATQNMTTARQETLMEACPGLLITAFVFVAEARLPVSPVESNNALTKAEYLAGRLSDADYEAATKSWPVLSALQSYERAAQAAHAGATGTPAEVHFVVCHCREGLDWLADGRYHMPARDAALVDLFVYEKCGRSGEDLSGLALPFREVSVVQVLDGDTRTDECSAYLRHSVDHYANPADFTLFFQADAGDHLEWGYLSLVMRAIGMGTLQADFVHLNYPRLVASLSPCRAEVFRRVFNRPPLQMLGSYCCAQFMVSRSRMLTNPLERYESMLQMLSQPSPSECHDIPGHSTLCLMYEVYWHVLFGEPEDLPEREMNVKLPLFLRIRDVENESYLPPGSLFLETALVDGLALDH